MSESGNGRRYGYATALNCLNLSIWLNCAAYSHIALGADERAPILISLGMLGVSLVLYWKVPIHAFTTLFSRSSAPESEAKWLRPWHRYLLPSMAPVIAAFATWFCVDSMLFFATGVLAPWSIPRLLVDYPAFKSLMIGIFVVQTAYLIAVGLYLEKFARP